MIPLRQMAGLFKQHTAAFPVAEPGIRIDLLTVSLSTFTCPHRDGTAGQVHLRRNPGIRVLKGFGSRCIPDRALF